MSMRCLAHLLRNFAQLTEEGVGERCLRRFWSYFGYPFVARGMTDSRGLDPTLGLAFAFVTNVLRMSKSSALL